MERAYSVDERLELLENGYATRFLVLATRLDALERRLDAYERKDAVLAMSGGGDLLCADPELVNIDAEIANAEH